MIKSVPFSILEGMTIKRIIGAKNNALRVQIKTDSGRIFTMSHLQDCCEWVRVFKVEGDVSQVIGRKVTRAEDIILDKDEKAFKRITKSNADYSATITIFDLDFSGTHFRIIWLGESNGCYGEGVAFEEII